MTNAVIVIRGHKDHAWDWFSKTLRVDTKVLNQAVKMNIMRFLDDFMFQLTKEEKKGLNTNCGHLNE